jgi:hypothetical protein
MPDGQELERTWRRPTLTPSFEAGARHGFQENWRRHIHRLQVSLPESCDRIFPCPSTDSPASSDGRSESNCRRSIDAVNQVSAGSHSAQNASPMNASLPFEMPTCQCPCRPKPTASVSHLEIGPFCRASPRGPMTVGEVTCSGIINSAQVVIQPDPPANRRPMRQRSGWKKTRFAASVVAM